MCYCWTCKCCVNLNYEAHETYIRCFISSIRSRTCRFFASYGVSFIEPKPTLFDEGGRRKPCDIYLRDASNDVFSALAMSPFKGLGDTWVAGKWETRDLVKLLSVILKSPIGDMQGHYFHKLHNQCILDYVDLNEAKVKTFGEFCDLQMEFFKQVLDPATQRFTGGKLLGAADGSVSDMQVQALGDIGNSLNLSSGSNVLVIGCLSGAMAHWLASRYDFKVTAVCYGQKSAEETRVKCSGFPVEILSIESTDGLDEVLQKSLFDGIVATEPFRGLKRNSQKIFKFWKIMGSHLVGDGKLILETKGILNKKRPLDDLFRECSMFIGGYCPNASEVWNEINQSNWKLLSWIDTTQAYAQTISHWRDNLTLFQKVNLSSGSASTVNSKHFEFAISLYEAALRTGRLQSWTILFSKSNN